MAGIIALLIPILALTIPIVAILTSHQRQMADMFRRNQQAEVNPEIDRLRNEVRELKDVVLQQTLALDNAMARTQLPQTPDVRDRLADRV